MPVMTIKMPPGLYMNGTPYERKARWADGNRVRWHNDGLRPIGGWTREIQYDNTPVAALTLTPDTETFRDGFSWVDNGGTRRFIYGSNAALKVLNPDGAIADVTPAGFTGSPNQPTVQVGYGNWLYGLGVYGATRPADPTAIGRLYRWQFDTWGEDVIAGSNDPAYRGSLYLFDTTTPTAAATVIANAPTDQNGFIVTDERVVMTIGSDAEARIVRWSDRENFSEWTPNATNWAGDIFLQGNGRLVSINKVLNQILILSEGDAHVARFIGAPFV